MFVGVFVRVDYSDGRYEADSVSRKWTLLLLQHSLDATLHNRRASFTSRDGSLHWCGSGSVLATQGEASVLQQHIQPA